MIRYLSLLVLITWTAYTGSFAQVQRYTVEVASFSSGIHDEFSPVFYKEGIVFCSNQRDNALIGYKNEQSRLFKIFFVTKMNGTRWKQPAILSADITTDVNDGPATFSEDGNIMYYSRNNDVEKMLRNISDTTNKLGIYCAEFIDGKWTNTKSFPYNNPEYSLCMPALSPDGERLYFSSDSPGGVGGMDLYYCNRSNNGWDQPVNLGAVINTPENESFPFAGRYGKLFFASDGHKGFGGKDLFYTQEINGDWINPVHLDSAINSPADDFGLVADSTFEQGYFSSNRRKTDDIFSFHSTPVEFTDCDSIMENNYCFTFYDEQHQLIDTLPVIYEWDFGNGLKRIGKEVRHCFPGSGKYLVKLSIMDEITGEAITEQVDYEVDLENADQAYIHSYNLGLVDQPVLFDGAKSHLEGFRITDYMWNFGEGFKPGQSLMSHTFKKKGQYTVQLGLLGEKDSLGRIPKTCVTKKISIYNTYEGMTGKGDRDREVMYNGTVADGGQNITLPARIVFMDDLSERQKEIIRIGLNEYGNPVVTFDPYGINASSGTFLDRVVHLMKENPGVGLEIVFHTVGDQPEGKSMEISEIWAQELAFYLKGLEMDMGTAHIKGMGSSYPVFGTVLSDDKNYSGHIEFIFFKN